MSYYFLTCNDEIRKTHIVNEFKEFNLIEVNPIIGIETNKSVATGFSKILDLACINQDRSKPFQPFAMLEDDVKKYREFPSDIEIPDDTDILYIGLSSWGISKKNFGTNNIVCSRSINEDIVRVYNMLSLHGTIICSVRGALAMQKCMLEAYFKNTVSDIFTSRIQPYLNVYALKKPLVYQFAKIGGVEEWATKIDYVNNDDNEIPNDWINDDFVSIITNYSTDIKE